MEKKEVVIYYIKRQLKKDDRNNLQHILKNNLYKFVENPQKTSELYNKPVLSFLKNNTYIERYKPINCLNKKIDDILVKIIKRNNELDEDKKEDINGNCINFEYDFPYSQIINSTKGDLSNEANLVNRYIKENKYHIYVNRILVHEVPNKKIKKIMFSIVRGSQAIKRKDVPLPKYSYMIPYDPSCDGIYFLTKSWLEDAKNKKSMLYKYVYGTSKYKEISNKPYLLLEQSVKKEDYNWLSEDDILNLRRKYFSDDTFVVCFCGKLSVNTYPKSILEAIKHLNEKNHCKIKLLIIGEITISNNRLIRDLYKELLSYKFIKKITCPKKDILSYYRICDILTSTYRDYCNEIGGCNKIEEFKLCNKPILCSRGRERERQLGKDYPYFYDCETVKTVPPLDWMPEFLNKKMSNGNFYSKYLKYVNYDKEKKQVYSKILEIYNKKFKI